MEGLMNIVISLVSSLLWRIRGGLRIFGKKVPINKVWYAVFIAVLGGLNFGMSVENCLIAFLAGYVSYQLYGWGLYLGRLLDGGTINPETDRECELIDNILYSIPHITEFPKVFGFLGMTLSGLIISFLWGLYFCSIPLMLSGLAMGVVYLLGGQCEKLIPLGKNGWNWGEWLYGLYLGGALAICLDLF